MEEKLNIIKRLQQKGANIQELNTIRIELSATKGGNLAKSARNASSIVSLIISDIVGDRIDLIASGPTVPKPMNNRAKAEAVLKKYQLWTELSHLFNESTRMGELSHVHNFIVGSNKLACEAATAKAIECGYFPYLVTNTLEGDVRTISQNYVNLIKNVINGKEHSDLPKNKSICFILAGETTVDIKGTGKGGRSQELALLMSKEFLENELLHDVVFLAAGTDGIDGPTDVAGAIGNSSIAENIEECNEALKNNDSFNYYKNVKEGKYHIKTGHTGTNVMDLHLILIPNKP